MRMKLRVGTLQAASLGFFVPVTPRCRKEGGRLGQGGCLHCWEGATLGCESPPAAAIQSCSEQRRVGGGDGAPRTAPKSPQCPFKRQV